MLEQQLHLTYPTDIWFDKWAIPAGGNIHQEVEKGVAGSDLVILMVSQASLASGWVEAEWRRKHHEEISTKQMSLICLIIDETTPEALPEFLHVKRALRLAEIQSEKGLESFCHHLSQVLHKHLETIARNLQGRLRTPKSREGEAPVIRKQQDIGHLRGLESASSLMMS